MNKLLNVLRGTFLVFLIIFSSLSHNISAETYYPVLNGKSHILIDADTGVIYLSDSIDEPLAIASLTKLMTIYLTYEKIEKDNIDLNTKIKLSDKAINLKKNNEAISGVYFKNNEELTLSELLDLAIIYSDNGAALTLAEYVSGSEEKFIEKMNEKAKTFNMTNTKFYNSTGLTNSDYGENVPRGTKPTDYNISSSRDMAKLTYHLVQDYPQVLDITQKTSVTYGGYEYSTYNNMLENQIQEYPGVVGMKTGTTKEAGECFIGYYKTEDRNYISVTLGVDPDSSIDRFAETALIYDWIDQQNITKIYDKNTEIKDVNIKGTGFSKIKLYPSADISILKSQNIGMNLEKIEYNKEYINSEGYIIKDIPENKKILTLVLNVDENNLGEKSVFEVDGKFEIDLVAHEEIKKGNIFENITIATKNFFIDFYKSIL